MAKCYTLKNPNQEKSLAPQPKATVLNSIISFSKVYEVAKSNKTEIGFILN